jgi:hypothetical protein
MLRFEVGEVARVRKNATQHASRGMAEPREAVYPRKFSASIHRARCTSVGTESVTAWTEVDDVGRQPFVVIKLGPVRLTQQFELELQDIAQRQTANGVSDQRLFDENVAHVPEASP